MRIMGRMERVFSKTGRGRPKRIWWETYRYGMNYKGNIEDKVMDKNDQRTKIHVADPYKGIKT